MRNLILSTQKQVSLPLWMASFPSYFCPLCYTVFIGFWVPFVSTECNKKNNSLAFCQTIAVTILVVINSLKVPYQLEILSGEKCIKVTLVFL